MAKISKKPPRTPVKAEINSLSQFVIEALEDQGVIHHEPITHIPNVDMFSTPSEVVIEVELPGVRKEDIDVSQVKNSITIKAFKVECYEDEKINYVCMERVFGRFFRIIEIPCPVDTVRVKAVLKDGVLTLNIPRIADKRCTTKRIAIES
ncbi:MAG: Hsp20/alpha crystallin family protein [Deltaproteobacteria bacterium]|nr:Hsp20/alpha crystallin family protein [Deltaproteobacteria bacterium]